MKLVRKMKLEQLLNEIEYKLLQGDLSQDVSQIDYDSRSVSYTHLS